jgi:hypothetical protein
MKSINTCYGQNEVLFNVKAFGAYNNHRVLRGEVIGARICCSDVYCICGS